MSNHLIYNMEQNKRPVSLFMKLMRSILRYHVGPKSPQHTLYLLHVYQCELHLLKEVLYATVCQKGCKTADDQSFQGYIFFDFMK